MTDLNELEHRFLYHRPKNEDIADAHQDVRWQIGNVARQFGLKLPDSREKSLALTKLEEAMFWANAAIARIKNYEEE